jgi:hypothetical protein
MTYLNETQRLTLRNTLLADPDLEMDAATATAISHILSPVVARMIEDETTTVGPINIAAQAGFGASLEGPGA